MLICIEGPDKVGKNTQATILAKKLNAQMISYPRDNTSYGKAIREILAGTRPFDKMELQSLHSMDKLDDNERVKTILNNHINVVMERGYPSAYVYGVVEGIDLMTLIQMNIELVRPDVVIVLDGTPFTLDSSDINENEEKQMKVRQLYNVLAKPFGWYTIHANQSIEAVSKDIWSIVQLEIARSKLYRV